MTFNGVAQEYNDQFEKACKSYDAFRKDSSIVPYQVDYLTIQDMIIQAAKERFLITDAQAQFIYSEVYRRYHSAYEDVIWAMLEYTEFAENYKKISA
jgi:hypothetical protein